MNNIIELSSEELCMIGGGSWASAVAYVGASWTALSASGTVFAGITATTPLMVTGVLASSGVGLAIVGGAFAAYAVYQVYDAITN